MSPQQNGIDQCALTDFIVVLEDVVPADLCQQIVDEYEASDDWEAGGVEYGIDTQARSVSTINVSSQEILAKNEPTRSSIDRALFSCAKRAVRAYKKKFPFLSIEQDSGYELLRYTQGQFYKEHTDSLLKAPRELSCSFVLNDGFLGGEFSFFSGKSTYKIPKGGAIMFPSNFMFPHQVLPIKTGTRYSVITWFL
jgi:predicted 2-oxoglutarate/Fe(II)-dependent dioxygenase YbiX